MNTPREKWGSKLGFILAASGSAVGIGNIWKFPHMAGQNGGAAFTLIYLICIFVVRLVGSEMCIRDRSCRCLFNSSSKIFMEMGWFLGCRISICNIIFLWSSWRMDNELRLSFYER